MCFGRRSSKGYKKEYNIPKRIVFNNIILKKSDLKYLLLSERIQFLIHIDKCISYHLNQIKSQITSINWMSNVFNKVKLHSPTVLHQSLRKARQFSSTQTCQINKNKSQNLLRIYSPNPKKSEILSCRKYQTQLSQISSGSSFVGSIFQAPEFMKHPSLIEGYRINFITFKDILKSLFILHNQTVNIWSHVIGSFLVIILLFSFVSYQYKHLFPIIQPSLKYQNIYISRNQQIILKDPSSLFISKMIQHQICLPQIRKCFDKDEKLKILKKIDCSMKSKALQKLQIKMNQQTQTKYNIKKFQKNKNKDIMLNTK